MESQGPASWGRVLERLTWEKARESGGVFVVAWRRDLGGGAERERRVGGQESETTAVMTPWSVLQDVQQGEVELCRRGTQYGRL